MDKAARHDCAAVRFRIRASKLALRFLGLSNDGEFISFSVFGGKA